MYVPGVTFAVCEVDVPVDAPEELPPQPEKLMMRSVQKQINAVLLDRLRFKGSKKTKPASAMPNGAMRSSEAACVDSVEIESVKFATVPPETTMVDGVKVHDALAGRLLHARLTVPE